jgi:hypothetical protein
MAQSDSWDLPLDVCWLDLVGSHRFSIDFDFLQNKAAMEHVFDLVLND